MADTFRATFPLWLLAAALALVPRSPIEARAYYVAPGDSLNADGTSAHPYPRIQQAANLMVAGDTCLIRAGVYRETVRPVNSGISGKPIVFASYRGENAVVHGGDAIEGAWSVQSGSIYKIAYSGTVKDIFVDRQCMLQARHPNMPYDSVRGGFVMLMPQDNAINPPAGVDWSGTIQILDAGQTWVNKIVQINAYTSNSSTVLIGPVGLLDSEGEWAFKNNILYLWAPRGRNPGPLLVETRSRDYGFNLQQRNYVFVKGITFFATSLSLDQANNCVIDSCTVLYPCPLFLSTGNAIGFNRENGAGANVNGKGVVLGGSNNTIRNCEIAHSWGDGITMYGSSNPITTGGSGHLIRRNTIHDAGRSILVHRRTAAMQIEFNDLFGAGWLKTDLGVTYAYNSDGQGSEIRYNWVHECYSPGAGIYLDNYTSNFVVHHNAIWSTQAGFRFWALGLNTPQTNNRFYNNTFDNTFIQITVGDSAWTNCNFTNNILQRTLVNKSPSQVVNQNNYEDSLAPPQFVDPDNGDLRLKPSSPCIDKGKVLAPYTDGYTGSAPDQGAYESGTPAWTAGSSLAYKIWTPVPVAGQISRRGFRSFASVNGSWSSFAFDGRLATRWDTYSAFPPAGERYFMVNMQTSRTFNRVYLCSTARPDQTIRHYAAYVSADGMAWGPAIGSGAGSGGVLAIAFPVQTAQYVKVVDTDAAQTWAIEEFFVGYDSSPVRAPPVSMRPASSRISAARLFTINGSCAGGYETGRYAGPACIRAGIYVAKISESNGAVVVRSIMVKGHNSLPRTIEEQVRCRR
jgi:parallel beta-helix repeat protein